MKEEEIVAMSMEIGNKKIIWAAYSRESMKETKLKMDVPTDEKKEEL